MSNEISLKLITPNEYTLVSRIINDPDHNKYQENARLSPLDKREVLKESNGIWRRGSWHCLTARINGQLVGITSLTVLSVMDREYETGIIIDKRFQGQGIGKNVLKFLSQEAFKRLNANRLVAYIHPENIVCLSIYKYVGFQIEGIARKARKLDEVFYDHNILSLLRNEMVV